MGSARHNPKGCACSPDLRSREGGSGHERDGPAQPRQAASRLGHHRGRRGLAGEGPSLDFGANRRFDQVPGSGDLAADEDLRRIECVDHHRKTEPEIAAGLHQGGAGALVAAGGAAYDLVHSDAALLEQLPGDGGRQVVPEVAGDRGQVRGVRLEAALRAAQAVWARSSRRTRVASSSSSWSGSKTVPKLSRAIWLPPKSESDTYVRLKRMSIAATSRSRVCTCSIFGRRPRGASASAPS